MSLAVSRLSVLHDIKLLWLALHMLCRLWYNVQCGCCKHHILHPPCVVTLYYRRPRCAAVQASATCNWQWHNTDTIRRPSCTWRCSSIWISLMRSMPAHVCYANLHIICQTVFWAAGIPTHSVLYKNVRSLDTTVVNTAACYTPIVQCKQCWTIPWSHRYCT